MVLHPDCLATEFQPTTMASVAAPKLQTILVYEWQAWNSFLISHLIDEANRVTANYDDPSDCLARALHDGIEAVLLQINVSLGDGFPLRRDAIIDDCRQRGVRVLNGAIADISKRHLHQILRQAGLRSAAASHEGDPHEWLFVKSNLNWGGQLERQFEITSVPEFGVTADPAPITRFDQYYKVQRRSLDSSLWSDPRVVIETYIHNSDDSFYRIYCFGQAMVIVEAHCPHLIKKLCGHEDDVNYAYSCADIIQGNTQLPAQLADTLRIFLLHSQLDYFCLDIVHNNHDYYIVDLNLTPYSGAQEQNRDMVLFLQEGIATALGEPHI